MPSGYAAQKITQFPKPHGIPKSARALIVDANETDRSSIRKIATTGDLDLHFVEAHSVEELTHSVETDAFDLVLLDYALPDGNGLDGLKVVSQSELNKFCATIMIASEADIQIAVTALKHGCSDYLLKEDLAPATLRRAVFNAFQKAELHRKINHADSILERLQSAICEQAKRSDHEIRPLVENALISASILSGQSGDPRLEQIELTCRNMLLFCDEIERHSNFIESINGV